MEEIVLFGLGVSIIIFLWLGFSLGKYNKTLADIFPIFLGRNASVNSIDEFSSSTTATTVSLATIILAYFQFVSFFGLWLLWTAITTAIGMWVVSFSSTRIWNKMAQYDHRPTLHEYLGVEYGNSTISIVGAFCTSLGYLLIFATELIVGSSFLAELIPQIPFQLSVIVLSLVGVTYVTYGGFRSVIKTDQWQMKFIWGFIIAMFVYYISYVFNNEGLFVNLKKIPRTVYDFSERPGLGLFLLGITIMNIPTHMSSMAVWQRIAGAQKIQTVSTGLRKSIIGISLSWGLIVVLACLAFMVVPGDSKTLLTDLLKIMSQTLFGKIILFIVVIGMYAALLSTSSTNLVAVGQTISEDLFAKFRKLNVIERDQLYKEFRFSRIILIISAAFAVIIVIGLKKLSFDVSDLIFSIYGGALALFPPIAFSLFTEKKDLKVIATYATFGVVLGFIFGWGAAFYGKFIGNKDLVFLSPTISIGISSLCLVIGKILTKQRLTIKNIVTL